MFPQVFDVRMNQFLVAKDLDIYDKVGYGVAHDEYIPFIIRKGNLFVGNQKAPFPGQLHVEFVKVLFFSSFLLKLHCHNTRQ